MMRAMSEATARIVPPSTSTAAARDELAASADGVIQTLRVTRSLAATGRVIRLDGLEAQVAQLCARCLGLDRQDQGSLRQLLLALRAELDATMALQIRLQETAPCPSTTY